MESGGVGEAAWEQGASEMEEEPQVGIWRCRDTRRQPLPPHPSPLTQGNTPVLIQSPKVPCLMSQLGTENEEGLDTHRGASEASRTRGASLTAVSLEEEEEHFGEMSQH